MQQQRQKPQQYGNIRVTITPAAQERMRKEYELDLHRTRRRRDRDVATVATDDCEDNCSHCSQARFHVRRRYERVIRKLEGKIARLS